MNGQEAWHALRARWRLLAAVCGFVVATTWGAALLRAPQYLATASVVVDFKPDPISAQGPGGLPTPAFMATQLEVARSERVAAGVPERLPAGSLAALRARWQTEAGSDTRFESWFGKLLRADVDISPARDSGVIHIAATAAEPALAAALADALMQSYIDTALALRVEPARQYQTYFLDRAQAARQALEAAQARLSAFRQQAGIVASDERVDIETARLNELSTQLTALQAEVTDTSTRQRQAEGASADRLREVIDHPLVSQLRAELARLEGQLSQLGTRLGDSHPQVLALQGQLAEARNQLQAQTRRVAGSVAVADSINRRREAGLREALEAQRAAVLRMKALRGEAVVLQRDVEGAQRAWDAIQQRLAQSQLESLSPLGQANVLSRATLPVEPAGPRLALLLMLALLLGAMAAVALALLLELRDRRVHSGPAAAHALALPLLGVLPATRLEGA